MSTPVQQPTNVSRRMLTATLTKSVFLSSETKHLEFEASELTQFNFTAGQFVTIREPKPDGKIHSRAYSIASPPRDNPTFDICLNRVENGFMSNWLCDLEVGASISFHGPHGLFVMREPRAKGLFIATGTGIAPFRSMAQWLFADPQRNQGHEYWLVYGTRYEDGIYYREEFEEMQQRHPNFHYVATLSRCREDWQGCRGYVQDYVRQIVTSHGSMQAYICGLNDMVDANRRLLTEEFGWDKKQIVFERYD
jgi:ferredoxin-NADP reductase